MQDLGKTDKKSFKQRKCINYCALLWFECVDNLTCVAYVPAVALIILAAMLQMLGDLLDRSSCLRLIARAADGLGWR